MIVRRVPVLKQASALRAAETGTRRKTTRPNERNGRTLPKGKGETIAANGRKIKSGGKRGFAAEPLGERPAFLPSLAFFLFRNRRFANINLVL